MVVLWDWVSGLRPEILGSRTCSVYRVLRVGGDKLCSVPPHWDKQKEVLKLFVHP